MTSRGAKTALTTSELQFGGAKQGAIVGRHGAARSRMKRLAYRFYLASDDTEPYRTTVGASFASKGSSAHRGFWTGAVCRAPGWPLTAC